MLLFGLVALALGLGCGGAWVYDSRALSRGRAARALPDLAALLLLFAATVGFFWRIVFSEQVWRPAGGGDLALFLWPTYRFAAETIRQGQLPLWNPYLFGGMPFVGDVQSGILYPINLFNALLANPLTLRDLEFLSILHFWIAGAGMYLLLRFGRFGRRETAGGGAGSLGRIPALVGAAAFEFSDLFITHFGNLNLIAAAAWLPLVFLFFRRALVLDPPSDGAGKSTNRGSGDVLARQIIRTAWPWAGVVLAISFMAGHVQAFLFLVLTLGLYALFETGTRFYLDRDRWQAAAVPLLLFVLTVAVAAGLAAPVLLPAVEMAGQTVRQAFSYEQAAAFSLPPAGLIGLLVPAFFGRDPSQAWWPPERVEVGYIGVLPLLLAVVALGLRRDRSTGFLALLGAVGLALALGGYAILHGWLFQFIPAFGSLRAPARMIVLLDFAVAALAAIGLDALLGPLSDVEEKLYRQISRFAPWVVLILSVAAAATAYSILILSQDKDLVIFSRVARATNGLIFFILLLLASTAILILARRAFWPRAAWGILALALVYFDLFSLGAYVDLGRSDPAAPYRQDDIAGFFQREAAPFRIDTVRTGVEGIWPPDTGLLYGLEDLNGENPLVLARFDAYWEALGSRSSPLYDLLNAKYILTLPNTPLDPKFRRVFETPRGIWVSENRNVLPRAFVVYRARQAANEAEATAAIHADGFQPSDTVILEGQGARGLDGEGPYTPAEVTRMGPNEIEVTVNARAPGYLVLSEVDYAGWRVWVDGVERQIIRADSLFRAVEVEPGERRIRFAYEPLTFRLGAVLAAITILSLTALAWFSKNRRQRLMEQPTAAETSRF